MLWLSSNDRAFCKIIGMAQTSNRQACISCIGFSVRVSFFAISQSVFFVDAQDLPPITITAQGYHDFGFGGSGGMGGNGWNGAMPFPGYPYLIAGAQRFDQASSVRCSATGALRDVTSQSSEIDRWQAAEQVYRRLKLFDSFWSYWGSNNMVDNKRLFKVTYADGYSEQWMVINPLYSMATSGQPMPNSMKAGNDPAGIVKADRLCG